MLKKIFIFILVALMLSLASCKVVEVIDHGTTLPEETTTPPIEYTPWGSWYSSSSSIALELIGSGNTVKLYSLTTGYYEYFHVIQTTYTRVDNVFTVILDGDTYIFTFDKYANTLTMSSPNVTNTITFLHQEKAPAKHPEYAFPDYTQLTPSSYITLGEIDYESIAILAYEGSYYNAAIAFYGDMESIPKLENSNRPVQSGDVVNINYVGKLDNVAFEGGTANGATLFVSDYKNGYIPGFTDGLIGHSVGETFDVEVTFPEDYHATDMAGKTVIFTMTINNIRNMILTDEQVASYTGNDYQTYMDWLEAEKNEIAESCVSDAILEACTEVAELPQESYLYFYQQTVDYYHMLASYYGISYEVLASFYGITDALIIEQAINQSSYNLALYILAEENSLAWSEEDYTAKYEEYIANYLETYPDDTREDACEYADKYVVQMKHELTEEKVLGWALDQVFAAERE